MLDIKEGTEVRVYWNLHKKVFSVQTRRHIDKYTDSGQLSRQKVWRVHSHHEHILLNDPHFKVSQAGNQRVRDEGTKNVHAYVTGEWAWGNTAPPFSDWHDVKYNPYKHRQFMCDDKPIHEARTCHLKAGKMRVTK